MGKQYDRKKVHKQALIGWLFIATGFAVQLLLETFVWGESRPDKATYIIGLPFTIGGIIFAHALITLMTGTEQHPLHHKGEDFRERYQANMIRIRRHFKVCLIVCLVGAGLFALFFITHTPFFAIGFFILFLGGGGFAYGYHQWARCPACRHMPLENSGGQQRVVLDLIQCPHCGATLGDASP